MGDMMSNPYVPFQMNYHTLDSPSGSIIPLDTSVTPCNVGTNVSSKSFYVLLLKKKLVCHSFNYRVQMLCFSVILMCLRCGYRAWLHAVVWTAPPAVLLLFLHYLQKSHLGLLAWMALPLSCFLFF